MCIFKTKDYSKPGRLKAVYGDAKKPPEENVIKSIRNLFKLKKKRKQLQI